MNKSKHIRILFLGIITPCLLFSQNTPERIKSSLDNMEGTINSKMEEKEDNIKHGSVKNPNRYSFSKKVFVEEIIDYKLRCPPPALGGGGSVQPVQPVQPVLKREPIDANCEQVPIRETREVTKKIFERQRTNNTIGVWQKDGAILTKRHIINPNHAGIQHYGCYFRFGDDQISKDQIRKNNVSSKDKKKDQLYDRVELSRVSLTNRYLWIMGGGYTNLDGTFKGSDDPRVKNVRYTPVSKNSTTSSKSLEWTANFWVACEESCGGGFCSKDKTNYTVTVYPIFNYHPYLTIKGNKKFEIKGSRKEIISVEGPFTKKNLPPTHEISFNIKQGVKVYLEVCDKNRNESNCVEAPDSSFHVSQDGNTLTITNNHLLNLAVKKNVPEYYIKVYQKNSFNQFWIKVNNSNVYPDTKVSLLNYARIKYGTNQLNDYTYKINNNDHVQGNYTDKDKGSLTFSYILGSSEDNKIEYRKGSLGIGKFSLIRNTTDNTHPVKQEYKNGISFNRAEGMDTLSNMRESVNTNSVKSHIYFPSLSFSLKYTTDSR
ncbi:MAG: hypothetical protein OIF50_07215 [Flavobacteriaceae bacterium]|nr:hypothetical protein [Flavobacteriaceae bacterium]